MWNGGGPAKEKKSNMVLSFTFHDKNGKYSQNSKFIFQLLQGNVCSSYVSAVNSTCYWHCFSNNTFIGTNKIAKIQNIWRIKVQKQYKSTETTSEILKKHRII